MTDLTEQWKKGELETNKYYYVRDISYILPAKLGKYDNQLYFSGNEVGYGYEENRELEVLAPVPSYEEYQKLLSDQLAKNEGEEINAELEHRLAMVKANGKYPDRISRLKSRVVALSEENEKLKSKLQLKETAYDFDTARLEEENAQLKELLKECRHIIGIEKDFASCHFEEYTLIELLTKIDEALK